MGMGPDTGVGTAEILTERRRRAGSALSRGVRQRVRQRSRPRRAAAGPERAAASRRAASTPSSSPARRLPRRAPRTGAPGCTGSAHRRCTAFSAASMTALIRTAPVPRGRAPPEPAALGPAALSGAPDRLRRGPDDDRQQRRRRRARRHRRSCLPRQPLDDGPRLLRCRRRAADRAAAAALCCLHTEFGVIDAAPGEIAVIPRGVKFRVELPDGRGARYVCENYGALFRLPELGPIGANGLANPRDFLTPVAAFEDPEALPASSSPSSRAICGRPSSTIRRSTSSPGTAITRRTNTISRGSTRSARSASTIRTRRSSRC